jgi:hypothetical protein
MRHRIFALPAQSFLLLLALLLLLAAPTHARADADDDISPDDDAYEETARVARVSLIGGDVSLRRAGAEKWERAALNVPLVEGDRLATGPGSRLEIQIDARNFVRVGEYATIDIVTLRAEGVALSLPEGTATVRLARFDRGREYFEIDAPGTTLAAQEKGLYRLDVERDGRVRVAVREGGRARLYSQTSGFTLRDGRTAMMTARSDNDEPDWEFADLRPFDNWDTWVDERERYLLARGGARPLRRLGQHARLRPRLAPARERRQQLQRLGALPLRPLALGQPLRLDVGAGRAVGLGAVPLRALGLCRRPLVLGAARLRGLPPAQAMVAPRARRLRLAWQLLRR